MVNGVSPKNTCRPTGASFSNSSFASSSPSTATRRRSATSRSWMNRPPAEQNDDPVAQAVEALLGLPLQADAERQQHHHRHGAPGDSENGEGRTELLRPQVREEVAPHVS